MAQNRFYGGAGVVVVLLAGWVVYVALSGMERRPLGYERDELVAAVLKQIPTPPPPPIVASPLMPTSEPTLRPTATPDLLASLPICSDSTTLSGALCAPILYPTPAGPPPTPTPRLCQQWMYRSNTSQMEPCRKELPAAPTNAPPPTIGASS